jgi:polygalacturonase
VSVGDDCIAIKAGSEAEAPGLRRACEDIVVTGCVLERGHGGVVIGSETSGGIRDVLVSDCVMKGTDRGIRIKTRRGRGGVVERIRASNLAMSGVLCPFTVNMRYACGAWGDSVVGDRGAREAGEGTPRLREISVSGLVAGGATVAAAYIDGLAESPVEGLSFADVSISMEGDGPPAPAEMADGAEPISRGGFVASHTRGLRLLGLRISGQRGNAYSLEDCPGLEAWACSPQPPGRP